VFGCGFAALRLCVKISSATVLVLVYFVSSFFILPSAFLAMHPAKSNLARNTEWVQIGGRENKR
jgi:hypothetical protein